MIVDNQKNQEKEIKLILQLLNAIKAKHTLSVQEAEEGKEAVFKRVEEKLGRRYNLTATRRTRLFRYWPVAASIAILILSSVIVSIGIINSRQVLTAQAPIVVEVPEGAITHLTLSDGTQVTLNGGSSLTYPAEFSDNREVCLQGEGFFDVRKKMESPFIVHTKQFSAKVLGTRFSFKAYDTDHQAVLTLERGSVQVLTDHGKDNMILSPNQQVIKDSHTGKLYCHEVDAEDYTCWKDGILVFKDQTLAEISTILERRFNVRIEIDSESIKYDKYVASFRKHVSLDDILKKLSYQRSWTYIQKDGKIKLVKKV